MVVTEQYGIIMPPAPPHTKKEKGSEQTCMGPVLPVQPRVHTDYIQSHDVKNACIVQGFAI